MAPRCKGAVARASRWALASTISAKFSVNWAQRSALFFVADRSDLVAMMTDPVFLVFNAAYAITFAL